MAIELGLEPTDGGPQLARLGLCTNCGVARHPKLDAQSRDGVIVDEVSHFGTAA
jgi:hypothetical protein